MDAMAAMHTVGKLPSGAPVFYAEEGRFDHPGIHVWDGEKHVRFVPADAPANTALRIEIENAINRHSAENASNTPDFILATYLLGSLRAFDAAVNARESWYGRLGVQAPDTPNGPALVPMSDLIMPELDREFPIVGEVHVTGGDKTEEPLPFDGNPNPR